MGTLDFLELRYRVEWPVNIVITEKSVVRYNKVSSSWEVWVVLIECPEGEVGGVTNYVIYTITVCHCRWIMLRVCFGVPVLLFFSVVLADFARALMSGVICYFLQIFSFMLRLKRLSWVLRDIWFHLKHIGEISSSIAVLFIYLFCFCCALNVRQGA